jgi:NADH dehydrogenase
MKILVTGSTGFVGRFVVNELLRRKHDVRVLARNADSARSRFNAPVPAVAGDVLDPATMELALADREAVVHLVGIIRESRKQTFDAVHRKGAENVVAAAQRAGVARLLHMSAMGCAPYSPP